MDRPIPAFYACYLLRSTVRHASLYVGSTPNPVRRLRQHNGEAKGGAVRTARDNLRPWEMTCLVTGFPSKIAALQFEWAWQHTHLTRHIAADERLTTSKSTTRFSPKSGKLRKRSARPRLCLSDRLGNLHLLLQSSSFGRWPLKVTFYAPDVFRVWEKWQRQHLGTLRPGLEVELDESATLAKEDVEAAKASKSTGIHALDVGYSGNRAHLDKSKALLESTDWLRCAICRNALSSAGAGTLICSAEGCSTMTHIDCLSAAFLEAEGDEDAILPTSGSCPGCNVELEWVDLVKEASLRLRGAKEIEALYKQRLKVKSGAETVIANSDSDMRSDDDEPDGLLDDEDEWHKLSDDDDEKAQRIAQAKSSTTAKLSNPVEPKEVAMSARAELVIEESDWDDAEVID